MENLINEIDQIMKPYYDNQMELKEFDATNLKEIEELSQKLSMLQDKRKKAKQQFISVKNMLKSDFDREINLLSLKLQNLKDEKENEINNYLLEESKKLGKNLEDQPYQLSKYFSDIKKDLEDEYNKTEQELVSKINELKEKKINDPYENIDEKIIKGLDVETQEEIELKNKIRVISNKSYNKSINIRETVEIKYEVSAKLSRMKDKVQKLLIGKKAEKYQLLSVVEKHNNELEDEQKKYSEILQKLSSINLELCDSKEWEELYRELNSVSNKIRDLQNPKLYILNTDEIDKEISNLEHIIQMIEDNMKIVEPTQEELRVCLVSMKDSEREELDRRKIKRAAKYHIENNFVEKITEPEIQENEELKVQGNEESEIQENEESEIQENEESEIQENEESEIQENEELKVQENEEPEIQENEEPEIQENEESEIQENEELKVQENEEPEIQEIDELETKDNLPADLIDTYTPVDYKFSSKDGKILVDSMSELCKMTFNDVIGVAKNIKSIKLDLSNKYDTIYFSSKFQNDGSYNFDLSSIESSGFDGPISLPNGEYFNLSDIYSALDDLSKRDKNIKYMVNGINSEFTISDSKIKKLKKQLKKCSSLVLMTNKNSDVKEIYGNPRFNEGINKHLGKVETDLPDDVYISRNELISELKNMYKKNRSLWFKKCIEKISNGIDYISEENDNLLDDNIENQQDGNHLFHK